MVVIITPNSCDVGSNDDKTWPVMRNKQNNSGASTISSRAYDNKAYRSFARDLSADGEVLAIDEYVEAQLAAGGSVESIASLLFNAADKSKVNCLTLSALFDSLRDSKVVNWTEKELRKLYQLLVFDAGAKGFVERHEFYHGFEKFIRWIEQETARNSIFKKHNIPHSRGTRGVLPPLRRSADGVTERAQNSRGRRYSSLSENPSPRRISLDTSRVASPCVSIGPTMQGHKPSAHLLPAGRANLLNWSRRSDPSSGPNNGSHQTEGHGSGRTCSSTQRLSALRTMDAHSICALHKQEGQKQEGHSKGMLAPGSIKMLPQIASCDEAAESPSKSTAASSYPAGSPKLDPLERAQTLKKAIFDLQSAREPVRKPKKQIFIKYQNKADKSRSNKLLRHKSLMAYLSVFQGISVRKDGTVSAADFVRHMQENAPQLADHAISMLESVKRRASNHSEGHGVQFSSLLRVMFPGVTKQAIADMIEMCKPAHDGLSGQNAMLRLLREAREVFDEANTSNSGFLSRTEVRQAISEGRIEMTDLEFRDFFGAQGSSTGRETLAFDVFFEWYSNLSEVREFMNRQMVAAEQQHDNDYRFETESREENAEKQFFGLVAK